MNYGTNFDDGRVTHELKAGSGYLILSPEENDSLKRGEIIKKISGDSIGPFRIVVYMSREHVPRSPLTVVSATRIYNMVIPNARKVLDIIVDAYPSKITTIQIAKKYGCSKYAISSRMKNIDMACGRVLGEPANKYRERGPHVLLQERTGRCEISYQATDELSLAVTCLRELTT